MNKIKKIGTSFIIFISGMISKVWAIDRPYGMIVPAYAVDPGRYGKVHTIGDTISKIGKITIPVVLFVIGLFVVLSKKITKKVKAIVLSVLVILAILGYFLMNYISTNF